MAKSVKTITLLLAVAFLLATAPATLATATATAQTANGKYDADGNGLIEIDNLEQLNAIRLDRNGNGAPDSDDLKGVDVPAGIPGYGEGNAAAYAAAFPTAVGEAVCGNGCHGYELARSLDFDEPGSYASGTVNTAWTGGAGWLPIAAFEATLHGNGNTVSNLYINRSYDRTGFFGFLWSPASIIGIGLVNARVTGTGLDTGALAAVNHGRISHSYSTGSVSGNDIAGGLVGLNYGEVSRSHAAVSVSGGDNPDALVGWYYSEVGHGGLVGWNYGEVSNSYATGSVSGGDNRGGLVGYNDRGEVHHSYATGSVSGGDSIGGLAGYNVGFITASYATGSVSGESYAGGLAGSNKSIIQATYATGSVTGKNSPGGLVGLNESGISHSYAIGGVVAGDGAPGGFIGENNHGNPGRYNYWNTDINATGIGKGIAATQWGSPVAEGKTTAELQSPTGYTGIYDGWENDDDFWDFGADSQYPALKADLNGDGVATWQEFGPQGRPGPAQPAAIPPPPPVVTPEPSPNGKYDTDGDGLIEIDNLEQLAASGYDFDGDGRAHYEGNDAAYAAAFPTAVGEAVCGRGCRGYELARSLDFDDPDSYASGTVNAAGAGGFFAGSLDATFNGNGYTISHLRGGGLFGIAYASAVITGIGLVDAEVSGRGALVDGNYGEVSYSYVTGAVTGHSFMGALVGTNYGVVRDSYSTATVKGTGRGSRYVGGLVGYNDPRYPRGGERWDTLKHPPIATISHSCATGDVWVDPEGYEDASWPTGGLVAGNAGTISHSCATGDVNGYTQVGGLAGSGGRISHSYATGNVEGATSVGGLTGWGGDINASYATGDVTASSRAGGLTGWNSLWDKIMASYATGDVGVHFRSGGGLIGSDFGAVIAGYATGNVKGHEGVGGLAGGVGHSDIYSPSGIVRVSGSVIASYAIGRVTGAISTGGLLGEAREDTVSSSYWNIDIFPIGVGSGDPAGALGLTTAELQSPTGYTGVYGNWNADLDNADGDDDPDTGAEDFWDFGTSSQYPALKVDFDGDGVATAGEFGGQGRAEAPDSTPTTPAPTPAPGATANGKYDTDGDGLIEIDNLEQLDAIRYDGTTGGFGSSGNIDGDGIPSDATAYSAAFPTEGTEAVCDRGCYGYELARSLDFRDAGSYASGSVNTAWTAGSGWTPIGGAFWATFDGNGHTISNLYVNRPDEIQVGLFANVNSGTIRGIGLVNADVKGGRAVGGLAGSVSGDKASVSGSYVTGDVSGIKSVGGLAGSVDTDKLNISDSHFTGNVSGRGAETEVGGLVGRYRVDYDQGDGPGAIRRSHADGTVSGQGSWCHVGGLVGGSDGNIIASYATSSVSCSNSEIAGAAGGLAGHHRDGAITASYATGSVAGPREVGGLTGSNSGAIIGSYATGDISHILTEDHEGGFGGLAGANSGEIRSSYATGSVSGDVSVGGLAGYGGSAASRLIPGRTFSRVTASYATGSVSGLSNVGGLMGSNSGTGTIYLAYWDTETSGQTVGIGGYTNTAGAEGKTTAELQAPTGYTSIYSGWNIRADDLWAFGTSSQYPVLKADLNGDGIATWQEFGSQRGNEPAREPQAPAQVCEQTIVADGTFSGIWAGDCLSVHRRGAYSRYYTFTLERGGEARITLQSDADTYLYLRQGAGRAGTALYWNDDINERQTYSTIREVLPAWTYTIEATTYHAADVDSFTLTVSGLGVMNTAPEFPATETGERSVLESTPEGGNVGAPVAATDPNGDTLTYTLGGADAESFDIEESSGQLQTKAALDYETKTSYTVEVTATDPSGDSATITVTITVTDVDLGTLGNRYDADRDEAISITELFDAIDDYFAGVINISELFDVIDAYFG